MGTIDELARGLERKGAETLLDIGVTVPIGVWRLPFRRKPVALRVRMRRPRLGGMMAIAREWLKTGVTAEELWQMSKEDELRYLADHGREVSRMIAWTLVRGTIGRRLLVGPVAWAVREWMEPRWMMAAMKKYVGLLSTDPFLSIIASAEAMNPLKPRASQGRKGS